ncbi:MAG TPA: leucine--tRNA ligase [Candidatus Babeliales bacterium]|nr:leucine--tRNA ligase [Candidatus Babeliales bacterium]
MRRYNPKEIEPKWQAVWAETGIYKADMNRTEDKTYVIPMLPYPSGDLHIGHWYNFGPTDAVARFYRMQGRNVLSTIGFDAFGLPAENAAIKRGIQPAVWTHSNIETMKIQIDQIGASYDWDHSLATCDPSFYHWNQWLFLKLYEKGLAYRAKALVNWDPVDKTVLANEQVVDGKGERSGAPVEQKLLEQWFFKITDYAERLLEDLDSVDWPQKVKVMQQNWIGKSQGALIKFSVDGLDKDIEVFTTRPDTIFGATYIVLAPEHPLVEEITTDKYKNNVQQYVKETGRKTELERKEAEKDKTGSFTGAYAINPANKEKIPIWIADYVLASYGTGAIMAVPAHDERDYKFAKKHKLPAKTVILQDFGEPLPDEEYAKGVNVMVYNPGTDLYLGLDKWANGVGIVSGGINNDESFEDCAFRELVEETGIQNIKQMIKLGAPIYSHYFNNLKEVNKRAFGQGFLAITDNLESIKPTPEAHETFQPKWMGITEIREGIERLRPTKGAGGVDHWLEMCDRAEQAVKSYIDSKDYVQLPYAGEGILTDSGKYNDMNSSEAREKIIVDLAEKKFAKEQVNYRLRDWLISRQRYWGTPIPIIYCDKCGIQPVPKKDLPVILPEDVEFELTGRSPLTEREDFVNTKCPNCGGNAKRETDTMDTFVDSSWYYLRYVDNKNDKTAFDTELVNKWLPVDHYIGGIEHAILHLLYARFITKFLHEYHGLSVAEPFKKLTNQGIISGPDGHKMSKSRGNVVNPDEQVKSYGADSLRMYLMFMGPYDQGGPYDMSGITGTRRFLDRYWVLVEEFFETNGVNTTQDLEITAAVHKTTKKVTKDLEKLDFNTAISAMMQLVNELYKIKAAHNVSQSTGWRYALETLTQLLAPLAPHITEEVWENLGHESSVHISSWPKWDEKLVAEEVISIAVQVNGRVRSEIAISADTSEEEAVSLAKSDEKITVLIKDKTIKKAIYVPGRLVSLVIS